MNNKFNPLMWLLTVLLVVSSLGGTYGLVKLSQKPDEVKSILKVVPPTNTLIDLNLVKIAKIIKNKSNLSIDTSYQYAGYIIESSQKYKLDPFLILSIIHIESNFNTKAINAGAVGLMQVMYAVHKKPIDSLFDPKYNINIGSKILKDCYNRGGNTKLALALYNGSYPNTTYSTKVLNKHLKYTSHFDI
jgi:soluble lytic murein transglycosylase-like protein